MGNGVVTSLLESLRVETLTAALPTCFTSKLFRGMLPLQSNQWGAVMSQLMLDLGIDKMSAEERMKLVEEIWDSISEERVHADLSDAKKDALQRRVAELDSNPDNVLTWDEIKAQVKGNR
jgi:putative addiction module component (TIGR02574 family)